MFGNTAFPRPGQRWGMVDDNMLKKQKHTIISLSTINVHADLLPSSPGCPPPCCHILDLWFSVWGADISACPEPHAPAAERMWRHQWRRHGRWGGGKWSAQCGATLTNIFHDLNPSEATGTLAPWVKQTRCSHFPFRLCVQSSAQDVFYVNNGTIRTEYQHFLKQL